MTDAEKTRLLAELVQWKGARCFEPLTNLAHAGEVLEAMRAEGWGFFSRHDIGKQVFFAFGRAGCEYGVAANLLSTAICHAALLAEGVKEEEL
jgi:hypothetical protein